MRIATSLLSAAVASTAMGGGLAARADTTAAHCDLYAPRRRLRLFV